MNIFAKSFSLIVCSTKSLIARSFYSVIVLVMLTTVEVDAQVPLPKQCSNTGEIPVRVPSFSCTDGAIVPKAVTGAKCKHPEDLYGRCVFNSRLGRLEKEEGKKKGVDIIFSCRKKPARDENDKPITYENDTTPKFYDIAVIQYDRNTGNTCFYQYLGTGNDAGNNLPAPGTADGKDFWTVDPIFCTKCHTNGPFIRSPHYNLVVDKYGKLVEPIKDDDREFILPSIYEMKGLKYKVMHEHYAVYDVDKGLAQNDCTLCHNIGAFRVATGLPLNMGWANELAAGQKPSIGDRHRLSPTVEAKPYPSKDGYHDYMLGGELDTTRQEALAAIAELEECLKLPTPEGCTVTPVSP